MGSSWEIEFRNYFYKDIIKRQLTIYIWSQLYHLEIWIDKSKVLVLPWLSISDQSLNYSNRIFSAKPPKNPELNLYEIVEAFLQMWFDKNWYRKYRSKYSRLKSIDFRKDYILTIKFLNVYHNRIENNNKNFHLKWRTSHVVCRIKVSNYYFVNSRKSIMKKPKWFF